MTDSAITKAKMRIIRALASGLALLALTLGVPALLLAYGRTPGWSELVDLPGEMLTDTAAFALLTVVAWTAVRRDIHP